ncbi:MULTISPECIES: daunorubicin resistance protein DrrA family ABC transporter ATP-binding protein [Thermoanaerobacterium]|uniref:Daunorubicin resistance ABC transporter ATPase subunit n=2 Tax=Thermoanaerobacterium TaxID=28895 RepID=W9E9C2_9THEO|nr:MULTISPECIES: daunorubicin resistance protein DrrA family ABC transporter ATP-binding protein [Thermoanaerobacterium]AFK86386.1 daunorubicin resistance ABC transporter ATPase subunit [Thermoanaerobacterium saccharolyticum JW/SL-YS485]ETO38482.1 daunorubicin resistance ABC transporter ATPase subunit [Thermoanaerobacterium aotearoense SCUT27]
MDKVKNSEYAVEVVKLVKMFDKKKAVDGISFTIRTGTICGLLGPNGAGKTTTINMLATLIKPDGGTAKIFGYDVKKDVQKVRQLIGLTGQYATLDESLTAMENLKIFARLLGFSRIEAKRKAEELLEEFSLTEAANRKVSMFSGGMRRRLDIAVSLLSNPPLIFLDEPTTGLDPRTRAQMWQTIRTLVKNGSTILLTTQYLDEADQLADDIVVIDKGKVVAHDTPTGLKRSISASSLQLTVKNPDYAPKAAQIVEKVLGGKTQISEAAEITIPLADTAKLVDVLTKLKEMGIGLTAVNVREPSLDEVFLALTGDTKEVV